MPHPTVMHEIITPNSLGDIDGIIWYNGVDVEWRQAKVHFLSHSLHYASGVFEGIRIYNGRLFQAEQHYARLRRGAHCLNMAIAFSDHDLIDATKRVMAAQKIINGYVRPLVWRGPGPMDFNPKPNPANIAIAAWPLEVFLQAGTRLMLSPYQRPPPNAGPWETKATGLYLSATLAKAQAQEQGFDDALMLSWQGYVADTTGTNIFLVKDDCLYTPKPDGFFAGLTRQTILELAEQNGIKAYVQDIPLSFLKDAQEIFLVGTAAGIVSVKEIQLKNELVSLPFPGACMTHKLKQAYANLLMN